MTEQDVINEEMYEEEDDDLPYQYRRLTAHLQTGSADFNRRLAAYLTNHVAMRTALDQAIASSYAQQFANAPHLASQNRAAAAAAAATSSNPAEAYFPSPMLPQYQNQHQHQHQHQSPISPPPSAISPADGAPALSPSIATASSRPSPYPLPGSAALRQQQMLHRRGSSLSAQDAVSPDVARKSSATRPRPAAAGASVEPEALACPSSGGKNEQESSLPSADSSSLRPPPVSTPLLTSLPFPMDASWVSSGTNLGPLSMALPAESQMMLGPAFDPYDPLSAMFMAGSDAFPRPSWGSAPKPTFSYHHNQPSATVGRGSPGPSPYEALSATLAPSALDLSATRGSPDSPLLVPVASSPMSSSTTSQSKAQTTKAVPRPSSSALFTVNPDAQTVPLKTAPVDPASTIPPAAATGDVAASRGSRRETPPPSSSLGGEDWCQFINDCLWE